MLHDNKVHELKKMLNQQQNEKEKPKNLEMNDLNLEAARTMAHPEQNEMIPENPPSDTEQPDEITTLKQALTKQKDDFLRKLAEFDNFKKRLEKEKTETIRFANEKIIEELLPILDGLESTLGHIPGDKTDDPLVTGVELVRKQFLAALAKQGLAEVSGEGDSFDPNRHEAIAMEAQEGTEPGLILVTHRKGYMLREKLLRAALVTVSS